MSTTILTRTAQRKNVRAPNKRSGLNARGAIFVIAFIVLLEAAVRVGFLPRYLPAPSAMVTALWDDLVATGAILPDLLSTLSVFAIGLVVATVLAVTLGLLTGLLPILDSATRITFELLRPIPGVALIPLAILLLGLGEQMRLVIVIYSSFWPMLYNTYYGVKGTDPVLSDTGRTFGYSRLTIVRRVVLPAALPSIATGVRVSGAIALIVTVTAELVAGTSGLGHVMSEAEQGGQIARMYAAIWVTGMIGYLINVGITQIERRVLRWSEAYRVREAQV